MQKQFLLFLILCFLSFQLNSQELKFFPVQGEKQYSGEEDFKILKSNYKVENNQLYFYFEIKDAEVLIDPKSIKSDHIEFWFSNNNRENTLYSYQSNDLKSDWLEYYRIETTKDDSTMKEYFKEDYQIRTFGFDYKDSIQENVRIYARKDFVGLTHWGFFGSEVHFFDLKQYQNIEVQEPNHKPIVNFKLTEYGYSYEIIFDLKNLLFLNKAIFDQIYCGIVLIDQDEGGLSIYANNNTYTWGDKTWIPTIRFNQKLKAEIPKKYNLYMQYGYSYGSLFYYDNTQWNYLDKENIQTDWWDGVMDVYYDKLELEFDSVLKGNEIIYHFSTNAWLIVIPSKTNPNEASTYATYFNSNQLDSLPTYQFNDGSIGFINIDQYMQSAWGRGPCGACTHYLYSFIKVKDGNAKVILEIDFNDGNMEASWPMTDELLEELIPDFTTAIWDKKNEQLSIKCYDAISGEKEHITTLTIGWDKDWNPILIKP